MLTLSTKCTGFSDIRKFVARFLPEGSFKRIFLKPNWVKHAEKEAFPIEALVTSSKLIEAVLEACIEKYPLASEILVGDVPLQICDFEVLRKQSGIDQLERKFEGTTPPIRFLDLRRERFKVVDGFFVLESDAHGDPLGYSEVTLGGDSFLEEVSHNAKNFRVSDYDPKETVSVHARGDHRYLIARSILESDLVINLPKMKTHQKTGITGALKNLVGMNGSKAYLVHHQLGTPRSGGDEFPDDIPLLIRVQSRVREFLQKRSRLMFRILKWFWEMLKQAKGMKTEGTAENLSGPFVLGAGSWHGNDSVWRMVYDLNRILLYGRPEGGQLADRPQREVLCILDGMVAGEGNGPMQPLPIKANVLAASQNPFLIDFAMAKLMGFDWRKMPMLANHKRFVWNSLGNFEPHSFEVAVDECQFDSGINAIPVIKSFLPSPGWKGHIELTGDKD